MVGQRITNSLVNGRATIDKKDYNPRRPLLDPEDALVESDDQSSEEDSGHIVSFFERVANGIMARDRARRTRDLRRYISFAWAIVTCLCAGSITAFSLYAPLFQERLHYTQLRINAISIAAELAMYLPVPLSGYLCDRYGPSIPSVGSGLLFGAGYAIAAIVYKSGPPADAGGNGYPFALMILSFTFVGTATSAMYLSAVTTCAKNFGRGRYKGLALAAPIAAHGLSGMWQSQVGSRLLYEINEDGSHGPVDVFKYFVFLAITISVVGAIGGLALQIVDEDDMIEEAADELARSGLLDDSQLFHHSDHQHGYGTIHDGAESPQHRRRKGVVNEEKKTWLLNEETRLFLKDRTMWLFALGFFLVTGPGEAFINNLGTIIGTLYDKSVPKKVYASSPATHVSIVAIMSTVARLFTGTLSDMLAPSSVIHQHRRGPMSVVNSVTSLQSLARGKRYECSRLVFLLIFVGLLSIGEILLASGFIQNHADRFWMVSASIGAGYGAAFSLAPIIVSVVWGVENFGTNWGIVATVPAAGATIWGLVYSAVYQSAAGSHNPSDRDALCHGMKCYASTFWAMAVSVWVACLMWFWAWRCKHGWVQRGIAV